MPAFTPPTPTSGAASPTDRSPIPDRSRLEHDPAEHDPEGEWLTVASTQPRLGLLRVRVFGEVDMLTSPRLGRVLTESVRAAAAALPGHRPTPTSPTPTSPSAPAPAARPQVVCDLDGVEFFSLSGLRVLLDADEHAHTTGVTLIVVAESGAARRLLSLTGPNHWPAVTTLPTA